MLHRKRIYAKNRIDNVTENDLISNGWDSWNWSGNTSDYTVRSSDIQRPDKIAIETGSTNRYWWIIMKYNNIADVWNDLKAGMVLKIPSKTEMDKFYTTVTKRDELK